MRILLVEDDELTAQNLKKNLSRHGYAVDWANNVKSAILKSEDEQYDLAIIDRMLPDGDGSDLCFKLIQDGFKSPILILTALGDVTNTIEGLDKGADDYLAKPFLIEVLLARIRALSRRTPIEQLDEKLFIEDLSLDLNNHEVYRGNRKINLSPKEFSLLSFLMRNKNQAFDRTTLYARVWNEEVDLFSNSIDVHIRNLRSKIDDKEKKKLIKTVRGKGYMISTK